MARVSSQRDSLVIAVVSISKAAVRLPENLDVQKFLQALQQQLQKEQTLQRPKKVNVEEQEGQFGSLKEQDIQRIFDTVNDRKREKDRYNINKRPNIQSLAKYIKPSLVVQPDIIANDLPGFEKTVKVSLSDSSSSETVEAREEPSEYSKVYVVLNSEAVKKSKNKEKIDALLSSLLVPPQQQPQNHLESKENDELYKGFDLNVDDEYLGRRRLLRDSNERYSNEEKEVRPMRPRERDRGMDRPSDRGDRGMERGIGRLRNNNGIGAMRTAIPYLHYRGDIYEKEEFK